MLRRLVKLTVVAFGSVFGTATGRAALVVGGAAAAGSSVLPKPSDDDKLSHTTVTGNVRSMHSPAVQAALSAPSDIEPAELATSSSQSGTAPRSPSEGSSPDAETYSKLSQDPLYQYVQLTGPTPSTSISSAGGGQHPQLSDAQVIANYASLGQPNHSAVPTGNSSSSHSGRRSSSAVAQTAAGFKPQSTSSKPSSSDQAALSALHATARSMASQSDEDVLLAYANLGSGR